MIKLEFKTMGKIITRYEVFSIDPWTNPNVSETTIQKDFSKNSLFLTEKVIVTIHCLVEMIQAIWLFQKLY